MLTPELRHALIDAALDVRNRARAPYSGFHVGAALLDRDGTIHVGCNVENASYGATLCAERAAVAAAIAAGATELVAITVAADGPSLITPCGICRQVLVEVAPDLVVLCVHPDGRTSETTARALLPGAFVASALDRATTDG